jgi:hypothetical protein
MRVLLQRCGDHPCPPTGCHGKKEETALPVSVTKALSGPASPIDDPARKTMERRFGFDFSRVRVHTDAAATASAHDVAARAYTVGDHVVFGAGQYDLDRPTGLRLLAHELTHVVQQRHTARGLQRHSIALSDSTDAERHADLVADRVVAGRPAGPELMSHVATTAMPQGDTTTVTMTESPPKVVPMDGPGVKVCARPAMGFQHGFVDAPPFRYSLLKRCQPVAGAGPGIPLISGGGLGVPLHPTAAYASPHGGDPCGKAPTCVECIPKPGVVDVDRCMAEAHGAYHNPSEYVVFPGPNSNTYAGTIARSCCMGMDPSPEPLGSMPGWGMSPAGPIATVGHCGEPANCEDEPLVTSASSKVDRAVRGGIGLGLLGAAVGGVIGALAGGPLLGALIGGGIGLLAGGLIGLLK